ncbi:hypothetical protein GT347_04770 [Xylophilus rhododendri]|uniref:Uncharacterized protein n=1 Tax=Xylophilus rhododendri TaxID=2697032 RepID=A0A857J0G8_9BURK|nr:hypothetical protein [Xylophilus rhododendri]QHI97354.1 hypothetical protein GT347_04770 [Xylophilus rhododendri]
MPKNKTAPPPAKTPTGDFQDSVLLAESASNLRVLVREAAARLKLARRNDPAGVPSSGFRKGNGRSPASRY